MPLGYRVRKAWRELWPAGAVLLVAGGLFALAVACCGCASQGQLLTAALDTAKVTLDTTERVEGLEAVKSAKTETESTALLDAIRAKWRPAWVGLATALAAALSWREGSGTLEALVSAYCSLQDTEPRLKLPPVVPCPGGAP
jgi:hypothetical protein